MRSFCTLALLALPWLGPAVAAPPTPSPTPPATLGNAIYATAQEAFQDLLNALPEENLQAALSGLKGWKDGVFESHHRGVAQVHDSNPALATKLIVAAVNDLKKRQARPANSTVVPPPSTNRPPLVQTSSQAPPPPQSSNPPPPSSSAAPPIVVPVVVTTTQSGRTIVQTSAILSEATASIAVTVVRTDSKGSVVTATETRPAIVATVTDSAGRTFVQTSAANVLPTSGEILTSTDSKGSTFVTTYTPTGGKISSIKLITTTGSDGKPSTITSYAFVDPTDSTPTSTSRPGLQNSAVKKNAALELALAGAGALAIFL